MPFGPCVSEQSGDVYLLFDKVSADSKINDEIVTSFDKQVLKLIVPEERWHLGCLIRCCGGSKQETYNICQDWVKEEFNHKYLITFGLRPLRYATGNNKSKVENRVFEVSKYSTLGVAFLCLPSLNEICMSSNLLKQSQKIVGNYIGVC